MSARQTTTLAILLLVLLLLGRMVWLLDLMPASAVPSAHVRPGAAPTAPAESPAPAAVDGATPAASPAERAEVRSPLRRVRVPRPPQAPPPRTGPKLSEVGGLTDRRPDAPRDGAQVLAEIQAGMEELRDDITGCLNAWQVVTPDLEGSVGLAFQLSPGGLTDAWVTDHDEVPFGPLTCFSGAVYDVDWSGITDSPVEVTFSFDLEPDEGAEP